MRPWFIALPLACVALASIVSCKRAETTTRAEQPASASERVLALRFAKVEVRRVAPSLELTGTLEPNEKSEVAAQTNGIVSKVAIDVGSRVRKGEVLVVIDASEAALRLSSAEAAAEQQKARLGLKNGDRFDSASVPDVRSAKESLELKKKEAERARSLAKEGVISASALEQAASAAEQAESQFEAARNSAEQTWAALNAAKAQAGLSRKAVGDTRILAPFDGAVVERRVSTGEFAQVGRVIAVVVDDNPLRLRIDVPETDVSAMTLGKEVTLRVAAYPGRNFRAEIKRISASVNASSRTLPVEADVPNDDGLLRPGFFATARVVLPGADNEALFVPKSAIGSSGNSSRVFVRAGQRVIEKLVVTGRHIGDLVEIHGPVAASEEVAIEGVDKLVDSQPVTVR